MKFIEIILQQSQIKEAKLYNPAKKASESPETGITIQNPAAFHVIRDSATMTCKYLPHFVFGHYANPFEVLKNKFTRKQIEEFVMSANSDIVNFQLLTLILEKAKKISPQPTAAKYVTNISTQTSDDPYGDYESYTAISMTQANSTDTVSTLCEVFGVLQ
jgi:hypothetical protein